MFFRSLVHCVYIVLDRMKKKNAKKKEKNASIAGLKINGNPLTNG